MHQRTALGDASREPAARLVAPRPYKYGWKSSIEQTIIPKGLNEDVIRLISAKKEEPEWMLEASARATRARARADCSI